MPLKRKALRSVPPITEQNVFDSGYRRVALLRYHRSPRCGDAHVGAKVSGAKEQSWTALQIDL